MARNRGATLPRPGPSLQAVMACRRWYSACEFISAGINEVSSAGRSQRTSGCLDHAPRQPLGHTKGGHVQNSEGNPSRAH
jgi:hypothetical protein